MKGSWNASSVKCDKVSIMCPLHLFQIGYFVVVCHIFIWYWFQNFHLWFFIKLTYICFRLNFSFFNNWNFNRTWTLVINCIIYWWFLMTLKKQSACNCIWIVRSLNLVYNDVGPCMKSLSQQMTSQNYSVRYLIGLYLNANKKSVK